MAVREACGIFDVPHMGEIETSRAAARSRCSGCSPITSRRSPSVERSTACSAARTGACIDDLFTYRLDVGSRVPRSRTPPNHQRDLAWFTPDAGGRGGGGRPTRSTSGRCSPSRARSRERSCRRAPTSPLPASNDRRQPPHRRCGRCSYVVPATPARTESSCCVRADAAQPTLWDQIVRRGARPAGLGARDTLRLEVCFHLYGNDLSVERGPIEARPRLVLQGGDGLHRRRGRVRRCATPARRRSSSPSPIDGPGIARQGNPVIGGGEVTSGTFSPCLARHRDGVRAERARPYRHPPRDRRSWQRPIGV